MTEICRLCLGEGELISIFETKNSLQTSVKIMSLASVKIYEGDKLPANICPTCADRLDNSYQFKLQCEESDLKLRTKVVRPYLEFELNIKNEDNFLDCNNSIKCELEFDLLNDNSRNDDSSNSNDISLKSNSPIENLVEVDDKHIKKTKKRGRKKKKESLVEIDTKNDETMELIEPTKKIRKTKDKTEKKISKPKEKKVKVKKEKSTSNSRTNQCYTCGKIVSSRFRLKMHMRTHTGEKPYVCTYCNKTFALSQNLKVHERVHTGEKPLLCGICGKTFAQSAGLVAHMRLHTGETPYKCEMCPSSFRTPGHLQYHIRQHTGEKNFQCEVCNRAFITKGDLTQHHRTHTGERPYICPTCGLRMSRSSHLSRHMLTHTGEKPHRCDICGTAYAQKGDLVRHVKKHAGENRQSNTSVSSAQSTNVNNVDSRISSLHTSLSALHSSVQPTQLPPNIHASVSASQTMMDTRHTVQSHQSMLDRLMDTRSLDNRTQMSQLDPRTLGLGLGLGLLHSHHV